MNRWTGASGVSAGEDVERFLLSRPVAHVEHWIQAGSGRGGCGGVRRDSFVHVARGRARVERELDVFGGHVAPSHESSLRKGRCIVGGYLSTVLVTNHEMDKATRIAWKLESLHVDGCELFHPVGQDLFFSDPKFFICDLKSTAFSWIDIDSDRIASTCFVHIEFDLKAEGRLAEADDLIDGTTDRLPYALATRSRIDSSLSSRVFRPVPRASLRQRG